MRVFSSWSGGKESALATYKAIREGHKVLYLLNFLSEDGGRLRAHRVKAEVIDLQSKALGVPIIQVKTSWEDYEKNFKKVVQELKDKGIEGGVFGDVDIEEHKEWVERVCGEIGVKPILPLWKREPEKILDEFLNAGFKAKVIATRLGDEFIGRSYGKALFAEVQKQGFHPLGENGEYHTFVFDGPIFKKLIKVKEIRKEKMDNIWFLEISAELETKDWKASSFFS